MRKAILAGSALAWIAAIYATSSTVIRPSEFFELLDRHTFTSEEGLAKFKILWGAIWIFVVKGWHFTEFAILQFLVVRSVELTFRIRSQVTVLAAAMLCCLFAASDEWHQTFVPDRFGTAWDALIDSLGVMAISWIMLRSRREDST